MRILIKELDSEEVVERGALFHPTVGITTPR
jgi:hypothetical protein